MDSLFGNFGKSSKSSRRSRAKKKYYYEIQKSGTQTGAPDTSTTPNDDSYYNFTITVEYVPRINNKRSYAGQNRLYSYKKHTYFYLFDITSWTIYTNDHRFDKTEQVINSTSKRPNKRFKISSLLTAYFYRQNFIPNRIKNKYFARLRQLLLDKEVALDKRKNKDISNRRKTSTFIRFGYKRRSVYLGLYIPCKEEKCPLPCASVLSQGRERCADHIKRYFQAITNESNSKGKGKDVERGVRAYQEKEIWSNRLGIRYKKYGRDVNNLGPRSGFTCVKYDSFTLNREVKIAQKRRLSRFLKIQKIDFNISSLYRIWPKTTTHTKKVTSQGHNNTFLGSFTPRIGKNFKNKNTGDRSASERAKSIQEKNDLNRRNQALTANKGNNWVTLPDDKLSAHQRKKKDRAIKEAAKLGISWKEYALR